MAWKVLGMVYTEEAIAGPESVGFAGGDVVRVPIAVSTFEDKVLITPEWVI